MLGGRRLSWESGTRRGVKDMRAWPGCTTGQVLVIAPLCVTVMSLHCSDKSVHIMNHDHDNLTEINMQGSQGSRSLLRSQ